MVKNLCVKNNEDKSFVLDTHDDLTGYSASVEVKRGCKDSGVFPSVSLAATGEITLTFSSGDDYRFPCYKYKIFLDDGSGDTEVPFYGWIFTRQ